MKISDEQIDGKNIKEITAPLKVEELKNFIEKKDTFYLINYKNSELRDGIFLNYLSNLDLPCEVLLNDCSYEEKEQLLLAYLNSKNIVDIESIALNISKILLEYRGINTNDVFENPALTKEETLKFILAHEDVIKKWEHFFESTIVYALFIMKDVDSENDIKSQVPHIDDSNYVGLNIVNLLQNPVFMEMFFIPGTRTELSFFVRQFEEYMFKGASLFQYYHTHNNTILALMLGQYSGEIDRELFDQAIKEAHSLEATPETQSLKQD